MANINDFKVVNQKSQKYFDLLSKELGLENIKSPTKQTERLGFYLFLLEHLTSMKDILDLVEIVSDTEFNKLIFEKKHDDYGVDAVFIDEDSKKICLFNFKYREKYKRGQQKTNETILTTKFINALVNDNTKSLGGKTKINADRILKRLNSNDVWSLTLYIVSNEDFINVIDDNLEQLKQIYDLEILQIGLNEISEFISLKPEPVNAELVLENDAIMSYTESSISSSKSYILRLSLDELIRITCNVSEYRDKYNIEDVSLLNSVDVDYSVLFDNVRGLVLKSKYNTNISHTLKNESSKFFLFNNGLTITADDITAKAINAKKKVKLTIKGLQVLNGGQTLRTIHAFNKEDNKHIEDYLSNGEILVRVFKTAQDQSLNNM